jgi:hypothetical protein
MERPASLPGRSLAELVNSQPGWLSKGNSVLRPRFLKTHRKLIFPILTARAGDAIPLVEGENPMTRITINRFVVGVLSLASFLMAASRSVHAEGCNESILKGGYGTATTGLINSSSNPNDIAIGTFVPFVEAVRFVFDGHGNISGFSTANYGGSSFPVTFTGTYSVKADCSGNMTVNAGANGIIHRDLVIVDDGKEVDFVSTDPGLSIAGSMKKQRNHKEAD